MKNNLPRFVLIASLALNISMLSAAGYFFYRHYRHKLSPLRDLPRAERHIFEKIQLKPEQITALKQKSAAFCAEMTKKSDKMARLKKALFFNLAMDNPEKEKITEAIKNINMAQNETQTAIAAHILDEKSILDDQQQDEFFNLLSLSVDKRNRYACSEAGQKRE